MAKITKFYFQQAKYLVGDGQGEDVILTVDYKNNRFSFVGKGSLVLRRKAASIARDLLKRKHAVNFAHKFRVY